MADDSAPINLTNHFLIAMPGLSDELFGRSVVFMCEHSERGALGLVINKPSDIRVPRLFEKVDLTLGRDDLVDTPVFQGGPVQTERGFVLHEAVSSEAVGDGEVESVYASTLTIPGGLEMTTSRDVLEALSSGAGPRKVFPNCRGFPTGNSGSSRRLGADDFVSSDSGRCSRCRS